MILKAGLRLVGNRWCGHQVKKRDGDCAKALKKIGR
jgi:hypothetical protein